MVSERLKLVRANIEEAIVSGSILRGSLDDMEKGVLAIQGKSRARDLEGVRHEVREALSLLPLMFAKAAQVNRLLAETIDVLDGLPESKTSEDDDGEGRN